MRTMRLAVVAMLMSVLGALAMPAPAVSLEIGQKAPDFALPGPDGKPVKLADLLGKGSVVIYTFIQAFTPT